MLSVRAPRLSSVVAIALCSSMLAAEAGEARALNFQGPAEAREAPVWIELIPAPVNGEVRGRDGRWWRMPDPHAVVARTMGRDVPRPLDYEHATEKRAPQGLDAPASGWLGELQVREGGSIWAFADWTPLGRQRVADREYRFVSPVFAFDKATKEILFIVSAALTNNPNLHLTALNQASLDVGEADPDARVQAERAPADPDGGHTPPEDTLDKKAIREAVGLPETATDDEVLTAARTAHAQNSAGPDLTRFVPREQYDVATNRAAELEAQIAQRDSAGLKTTIETALNAAQAAGKITPASRAHYQGFAEKQGVAAFNALVESLPVIAQNTADANAKPPGAEKTGELTDEERAVCSQLGIPEETYRTGKAA